MVFLTTPSILTYKRKRAFFQMSAEYPEYVEYYKQKRLEENKDLENNDEDDEEEWLAARHVVGGIISANKQTIFETDAKELDTVYLHGFPVAIRNIYDCHCCLEFIRQVGKLVVIDPNTGQATSLLRIANPPNLLRVPLNNVAMQAEQAPIIGLFVHQKHHVIGRPSTGKWFHLHCELQHTSELQIRWCDYDTLSRFLQQYSDDKLNEYVMCALDWLASGKFARPEALKPHIVFLQTLLSHLDKLRQDPTKRSNLLWLEMSRAPVAFCHWSQSLPGKLINAIHLGQTLDLVAPQFNELMGGNVYQRPQTEPSAGNVARAEKLLDELKLDLRRRLLRLEEVPERLWPIAKLDAEPPAYDDQPSPSNQEPVFPQTIASNPERMSWLEFKHDQLPKAERIFYYTGNWADSFGALSTAVDPNANPLLQWDLLPHEGGPPTRNPVSWYMWTDGSHSRQYNLLSNTWSEVSCITHLPHMWNGGEDKFSQHSRGIMLVLKDAFEQRSPGLALFPSMLRSDLREVRATIEHISKMTKMESLDQGTTCGVILQASNSAWKARVLVQTKFRSTEYVLDRWGKQT